MNRERTRSIARTGVLLILLGPLLGFTLQYLWRHHGFSGYSRALGDAIGHVAADWAKRYVDNPLWALLRTILVSYAIRFVVRSPETGREE